MAQDNPADAHSSKARRFGLDLLRAIAVSLVVVGHWLQHSKPPDPVKHFGRLGILGVEIFFVLSGFLIGGIILELIRKGRFENRHDLFRFWGRRWLRTLPLYYLFFFIYLRWDWTGPSTLSERPLFLVFMQNFAWKAPDFFLLSWSLCIEEHFYLLFPLVFFAIRWHRREARSSLVGAMIAFLTVPLVVKLLRAPYDNWDDFNYGIRMVVITRLDSLMYGVGAAYVRAYHPDVWVRLGGWWRFSLVAVLGCALYIYVDIPGLPGNRIVQTLLFPVVSLSTALLLPALNDMRADTSRGWRRAVVFLSMISYSVYLGHILVLTIVNNTLHSIPGGWDAVYPYPTRLYPIYAVLIAAFTPLTYYFWEQPFMRWRDRHL